MYWHYENVIVTAIQSAEEGPTYTLVAETGEFSLAGQDVSLLRSLVLVSETGEFALAGQDLGFLRSYVLPVSAGVFSLSGQQMAPIRSLRVTLDTGNFSLAGQGMDITKLIEVVGLGVRWHNQVATYWPRSSDDGYGGYSYGIRQAYAVRWEDRIEELRTKEGELVVSQAVVWVPIRLEEGGYLYLGQSDVSDPTTLHDAHVIRKVVEIPSIRGESVEYRVYL